MSASAVLDAPQFAPLDSERLASVETALLQAPLRLHTPQQVRQLLFGPEVADEVRPTKSWLAELAATDAAEHVRIGQAIYYADENIRALVRQHQAPRRLPGRAAPGNYKISVEVEAALMAAPLRLYSAQEVRELLFGPDVHDAMSPTAYWFNRRAGERAIEHTRFGRAVWFAGENIRALIRQHMVGPGGLPKYPVTRM